MIAFTIKKTDSHLCFYLLWVIMFPFHIILPFQQVHGILWFHLPYKLFLIKKGKYMWKGVLSKLTQTWTISFGAFSIGCIYQIGQGVIFNGWSSKKYAGNQQNINKDRHEFRHFSLELIDKIDWCSFKNVCEFTETFIEFFLIYW